MLQSAIMQLINDVDWDFLDYLIIDFPPGTGDTQLTIMQKLKIDHALIVTTPQEIALADTRKGINMFKKNPLTGVGISNYQISCLNSHEYKSLMVNYACASHPHNYYLQFLTELGLIGFSFMFAAFIFCLINYFKSLFFLFFKKKC